MNRGISLVAGLVRKNVIGGNERSRDDPVLISQPVKQRVLKSLTAFRSVRYALHGCRYSLLYSSLLNEKIFPIIRQGTLVLVGGN